MSSSTRLAHGADERWGQVVPAQEIVRLPLILQILERNRRIGIARLNRSQTTYGVFLSTGGAQRRVVEVSFGDVSVGIGVRHFVQHRAAVLVLRQIAL